MNDIRIVTESTRFSSSTKLVLHSTSYRVIDGTIVTEFDMDDEVLENLYNGLKSLRKENKRREASR